MLRRRSTRAHSGRCQGGQASLLMLAVVGAVLAGALVLLAFDRMAAAAREEAGLFLGISSGYRSDAEQAKLFAAHPDPKWVAPPGESLHRYATELDLGPPIPYGWLQANAGRFGFVQRYAWDASH